MQTESNKTAFITGASSGIGYNLAHEFAKNKYNLVLVARDETQLLKLKEECEKKYSIQATILSCDLSHIDVSINAIKKLITHHRLHIDVLVNNAGFGIHGDFCSTSLDKEVDMVNLQTSSVLSLTKMFLPAMLKKGSGAILNVASVYSYIPVPYQSVYGACKAFLLSFSLSLAHEVKKQGVKVTVLCPGTTKTQFRTRSKLKTDGDALMLKGMPAQEVAKQAYESLNRGDLICVPGATNKMLVSLSPFLPSRWLSSLTTYVNNKRGVNHT